MNVFQYPKSKHRRTLTPRQFKRYGTYKRYLQTEFFRVCVYCRQPDSSAPNLNYGVDHYRPKGIKKFANLLCDYQNLYYCCGSCNSRKNNYWPTDEISGPFVVNPCEHEMAKHLSFNARTGEVEPKSPHGIQTEKLLQLNEPATVSYRRQTLKAIESLTRDIAEQEQLEIDLSKLLTENRIDQATFDQEVAEVRFEIDMLRNCLMGFSGTAPLRSLKKQRQGIVLLS